MNVRNQESIIKTKILVFLGFHNPFPGAAWNRISFISKYLCRRGYIAEILGAFKPVSSTYYKSYTLCPKSNHQVQTYNSVFTLGLSYKTPLAFIFNFISSFFISLIWLLTKLPKIVVSSMPQGDTGLGFVMASLILKRKVIIDHRDQWDEDYYVASLTNSEVTKKFYKTCVKKIVNVLYRRACAVTTVTPSFEELLRQRGIKNVVLIPNGADITTFKPINKKRSASDFRIIFSGWMGSYYRFDELVVALKYIKDKGIDDAKLVLVGEGNELTRVLTLASKLRVRDFIDYEGVVNVEKLAEITATADVGIIPGLYSKGQLPVKFFEYCACGIPVVAIAPDDSELASLILENRVGLVCNPNDVKGLFEALERMYVDQSFREDAGMRARSLINEHFDRNKINEKFLGLIQKLDRQM
jgi:glycosyltransferase involved in cell wall biosynthesis